MNSDVLALYLSFALALTKTIENLLSEILAGYQLFFTLLLSSIFWLTARHVCDILTRKEYIRTLSERRFKMNYVFRDEKPIAYIMLFFGYLLASGWTALVVAYGPSKG